MTEKNSETHFWAATKDHCSDMARKQGWKLKRSDKHGKGGPLPVDCVFEGDVEFPKAGIDYSAGGNDDA